MDEEYDNLDAAIAEMDMKSQYLEQKRLEEVAEVEEDQIPNYETPTRVRSEVHLLKKRRGRRKVSFTPTEIVSEWDKKRINDEFSKY